MNYVTVKPRHRRKHSDLIFPHFGNILNEMMRTNISEVVHPNMKTIKYTVPPVNVVEENEQYRLDMAIPGLDKSEIKIRVEEDKLIIISEKENTDEKISWKLREFNYGQFERSFIIPDEVDQNKIDAEVNNGILSIQLHKKEDKIEKGPQKIVIS